MNFKFTYKEYIFLLLKMIEIGNIYSFKSFSKTNPNNGYILRHDVDIDLNSAYKMSCIEKKVGISSTYFILTSSDLYNINSKSSRKILNDMVKSGFEIGLHFDPTIYGNISEQELCIQAMKEVKSIESIIGEKVESISLHNPSIHNKYPKFAGYNNAYDKRFFQEERYLSDSCKSFRGKDIYEFVLKGNVDILQMVLHPIHFSDIGKSYYSSFVDIICNKIDLMNQVMQVNKNYLEGPPLTDLLSVIKNKEKNLIKKQFEFKSKDLLKLEEYTNQMFYDTTIYSVSPVKNPRDYSLIFVDIGSKEEIYNLQFVENSIIIINEIYSDFKSSKNHLIYVERPRKEYAKILSYILQNKTEIKFQVNSNNSCYLTENIGENTIIEPFCLIDSNVKIGKNCFIKAGSKIRGEVKIGDNCIIKENCVIGSDGFGVERDEMGCTFKIPHVGGVNIGNNVEVGACSVIAQGTIEPTIIEDFVKIDDCCFIAHNVHICKGSMIVANSEISGSVLVGKNSWISPNACIRDGVTIGENCIIGMGSVVLKDVESNTIIVGNPGKPLKC